MLIKLNNDLFVEKHQIVKAQAVSKFEFCNTKKKKKYTISFLGTEAFLFDGLCMHGNISPKTNAISVVKRDLVFQHNLYASGLTKYFEQNVTQIWQNPQD